MEKPFDVSKCEDCKKAGVMIVDGVLKNACLKHKGLEGKYNELSDCTSEVKPKFESKIAKLTKLHNDALKCPDCQKLGVSIIDGVVQDACPKHEATTQKNPLGINLDVYEEITPEPEKKQKISQETKDFLYMQERVISKLNRHPEIYKILDDLFYTDILERLLGKTIGKVSEVVPTHLGGDMAVEPSKKTKKMFESLEKQFAVEDEKTGKKPYEFTEEKPQRGQLTKILDTGGYFNDQGKWVQVNLDKPFEDNKANLKICKQNRKRNNVSDFYDYHEVDCKFCLAQKKDCPLWKQKEETKK